MMIIAYGLETGNPFAYFLIFMILYPPIMTIGFALFDWIKIHMR